MNTYMSSDKTVSEVYEGLLSTAMTEYLFGAERNLDPLYFDDSRISYYVLKRISRLTGEPVAEYHAEQELFARFWPPGGHAQLLHIVGGAGSGKSTFLRYFFQYFMQYHERLVNNAVGDSPEHTEHLHSARKHILLYIDLRFREKEDIRSEVFHSLGKSLHHEAKRLALPDLPHCSQYDEAWVRKHLTALAQDVEEGKRRWYISCVVDNSDQLGEEEQRKLTEIARFYLAPQIPIMDPAQPVVRGDGRTLWRVIIPLRPDTRENLTRVWNPFPNRAVIELNPINPDALMETRATLVHSVVAPSRIHHERDRPYMGSTRPGMALWMPQEMAESLRDNLLAASILEGTTASPAKSVVDDLASDSARRRLHLLPRIAFSEVFHQRRALGLEEEWTDPVSPFYFFDGLIRGDRTIFDPQEDPFLLNLYGLGAEPKDRPHSVLVGVHATYLLSSGSQWADVRTQLAAIGYPEDDLTQCEFSLVGKELVHRLWDGQFHNESRILKGHWALLKERAYTDNMAVACAHSWGLGTKAKATNPLEPSELLDRFQGSLWFMQQVWKCEKALAHHAQAGNSRCGTFAEFVTCRRVLMECYITRYIATEYLYRVTRLPKYDRTYAAIRTEQDEWKHNVEMLTSLVRESRDPRALNARQS